MFFVVVNKISPQKRSYFPDVSQQAIFPSSDKAKKIHRYLLYNECHVRDHLEIMMLGWSTPTSVERILKFLKSSTKFNVHKTEFEHGLEPLEPPLLMVKTHEVN